MVMRVIIKYTSQTWCNPYFPWYYSDRELTHPLWQLQQACTGISDLLQCTNLPHHVSCRLHPVVRVPVYLRASTRSAAALRRSLTFDFMQTLTSSTCLEPEEQDCFRVKMWSITKNSLCLHLKASAVIWYSAYILFFSYCVSWRREKSYYQTLTSELVQCVTRVFGTTLIDLACFSSPLWKVQLLKIIGKAK